MRREQVHTTRLLVTSRSSSGFHSIVSSTCASALLSLSLSLSCPVGRAGSTSRRGVVDGVGMEVVRWIGGRNVDGRWTMDEELEEEPMPNAPEIPRPSRILALSLSPCLSAAVASMAGLWSLASLGPGACGHGPPAGPSYDWRWR